MNKIEKKLKRGLNDITKGRVKRWYNETIADCLDILTDKSCNYQQTALLLKKELDGGRG